MFVEPLGFVDGGLLADRTHRGAAFGAVASVVDAGGDALRAVLQGAERGVVERVDDELAHGRNVAGGGGDEMVIAGGGEHGVGVAVAVAAVARRRDRPMTGV